MLRSRSGVPVLLALVLGGLVASCQQDAPEDAAPAEEVMPVPAPEAAPEAAPPADALPPAPQDLLPETE